MNLEIQRIVQADDIIQLICQNLDTKQPETLHFSTDIWKEMLDDHNKDLTFPFKAILTIDPDSEEPYLFIIEEQE